MRLPWDHLSLAALLIAAPLTWNVSTVVGHDVPTELRAQQVASELLEHGVPVTAESLSVTVHTPNWLPSRHNHELPRRWVDPLAVAIIAETGDVLDLELVGARPGDLTTERLGWVAHVELIVDDPRAPTTAVLAETAQTLAAGERLRPVIWTAVLSVVAAVAAVVTGGVAAVHARVDARRRRELAAESIRRLWEQGRPSSTNP